VKRDIKAAARKALGPRFIRHYIYPLNARTRVSPGTATSQQDELAQELNDSLTIMQGYSPLKTRYHYNAVENSILYHFFEHPPTPGMAVLDVGSGAGHWIDFYRSVLGAGRVVGVELVPQVAAALQRKYEGNDDVTVLNGDVVDGVDAQPPFDVVNAIGVMFHIVEDDRWRRAVANLAAMLRPGGVMIVGGQFGPITHDVGFRRRSDAPATASGKDSIEVFKRLRSRRQWRDCAKAAGLRQVEYIHTRRSRMVDTPESNLLVFERTSNRRPAP
jgi:protein-L-isoaspartate O-methyltransferase